MTTIICQHCEWRVLAEEVTYGGGLTSGLRFKPESIKLPGVRSLAYKRPENPHLTRKHRSEPNRQS